MLRDRETEKAAELVWGAYALLVKSAAARRGFPLRSHQALRDFAHGIGMELGRILSPDQGDAWLSDFTAAEALHNGFYEGGPDPVAVARLMEKHDGWKGKIDRVLATGT